MRTVRGVLAAAGLALLGCGCYLLFAETREGTVGQVVLWLAGAVASHDFVLVPLVLLAGLAVRRAPARTVWRGGLITAGCLTAVALPMMLWQGSPSNPTVLPLDYRANWLLTLAGTAVATLCALLVRTAVRGARAGRRHRNDRP